ncbi:MAG TPA: cytochrome ubiquinol oxidase subunit I [Candidatus Binataceae bacterium]|jgi:cytochrome d ubiquinol oxidase subunit I|nr:cytochrome ubiquinol oxidase subunit I [Candidatus Binataceae bacterium]
MPNLFAARSQMAMSLAFHIIFSCVGIAMPLLMVIAEWLHRRTGDDVYLLLARRWATGTAIMFAVGAVSGTVLSFELGLLWPHFMKWAGAIIGMPFSLEGFAFFTEAIFLGIYLYGWDRVTPRAHLAAGFMVAISGMISGVFVVIANSWMNTPTGFRLVNGLATEVDPIASLNNPAALHETVHMTIAAYAATGFVVAGIHAAMWLRDRGNLFHRHAIAIAFSVGAIAAVIQPISGDASARAVERLQPAKMAAFEGLFKGGAHAPLAIGGIPDVERRKLLYAIELPSMLSIMTDHTPDGVIRGLDSFPEKDWPSPMIAVHLAFQIMVGAGFAMAGLGLWGALLVWRRRTIFDSIWFLRAMVAAAPLGLIAVEAGWVVTEVGRQPWIIYGVMRTADALTPMPGLTATFALFSALYIFLGVTVVRLIWRQVMLSPPQAEAAPGAGAVR